MAGIYYIIVTHVMNDRGIEVRFGAKRRTGAQNV